jgi:hypothetical protein
MMRSKRLAKMLALSPLRKAKSLSRLLSVKRLVNLKISKRVLKRSFKEEPLEEMEISPKCLWLVLKRVN